MPTTLSPLRYPGGKSSYAEMLSWIIKNNNLDGCYYAEPFAGGAGAAIKLLLSGKVKKIFLNDLDYTIYSFWYSILEHTEEFIQSINNVPVTIPEWKKQKQIYLDENSNIFSLGFATFFLNRCNHSGILLANPVGGIHQNAKHKINARFNKAVLVSKIREIAEHKKKIKLFNLDALEFIEVLKKYKSKILVYFDPPYFQKGELLYLNHYDFQDHRRLSKKIISCDMPWLLSYDDQPDIALLYKKINTYRKNLNYSISTPSVGHELIISKLEMPEYLEAVKRN